MSYAKKKMRSTKNPKLNTQSIKTMMGGHGGDYDQESENMQKMADAMGLEMHEFACWDSKESDLTIVYGFGKTAKEAENNARKFIAVHSNLTIEA